MKLASLTAGRIFPEVLVLSQAGERHTEAGTCTVK